MSEQHTPRSLIVTFYGAHGRAARGPVPVADLVRLLAPVGVDAPSVRSSVSRLKRRGLLVPARTEAGAAGYALSPDARQLLEDGDRRIYGTAAAGRGGGWVLAVFSVPEAERHKRHVLRSRLAGLGFGTAAPGVWIAPAHLYEETRHTLERLQLAPYVDLFRGEHLGYAPTADAVSRWWDLSSLAKQHEAFLTATSRCSAPGRPARAPTRRPRRPTATISWPSTPGGSSPTPTPGSPPSCSPPTGPAPARPRCSRRSTPGSGRPGPAS
ncbi:hypothetical protein SALBM135S_08000 [Streptomyces alboniger]